MSKTTSAASSPVFIRQKIPTTAKEQRLQRVLKKKHDSEKYFARRMAKSECKNQKRLTTTGISCANMKVATAITLYLNNTSAHKQFFARKTLEPFK